jgi:hypothetical protein
MAQVCSSCSRRVDVIRLLFCSVALASPAGPVYVGNFEAGDFSGEGNYNYSSGSKYSGSWLKGKMSGKGKYVTKNGDSYEGEYRDGHREGKGTLLFSAGIQYQGDFVNGCGEGTGTLLYPSGTSYEGQFKDEMPHGSGVLSYANGCRCEGEFAKGRMHGCCKFFFSDGNVCVHLSPVTPVLITTLCPTLILPASLRYVGYYADGRRIHPPGVKSFAEVTHLLVLCFAILKSQKQKTYSIMIFIDQTYLCPSRF